MKNQLGSRRNRFVTFVLSKEFRFAIGLTMALGLPHGESLAKPPNSTASSKANKASLELIDQAVQAEMHGDRAERDKLLEQASAMDKPHDLAHSYLGKIKLDQQWMSIESAIEIESQNAKLLGYEAMRADSQPTVESHWQLAEWCKSNKLDSQRRAHLHAILKLAPDHADARSALGHRRFGDRWITPEEQQRYGKMVRAQGESLAKYGKEMKAIANLLERGKPSRQVQAKRQLAEITDNEAIHAAEVLVTPCGRESAKAVVAWLGQMPGPIASQSLARHAIYHADEEIRTQAAMQLVGRNPLEYAGPMMNLLSYPIRSRVEPVIENGELVGYRQAYFREGRESHELTTVETQMQPSPLSNLGILSANAPQGDQDPVRLTSQLINRTPEVVTDRQQRITQENQVSSEISDRVMSTLQIATKQALPKEPRLWWNWYDSIAYVTRDSKPVREYSMTERAPSSMAIVVSECFVEGTPVWTNRGPKAIDQIRVGDLVLTTNIDERSLEFRPVVLTNRRPASTILCVDTGHEQLRCTRGHFFWVSGKGWTLADDLVEGDVLHGASGPAVVQSVLQEDERETYNLEVESTGCYFVGNGKILAHDMTTSNASPLIIPGRDIPRDRLTKELIP